MCGQLDVAWLLPGMSFNSKSFCDAIFAKLLKTSQPALGIRLRKRFFLEMDNAKGSTSKAIDNFYQKNSQDASSTRFLEELQRKVQTILDAIPQEEIRAIRRS
jgi:hypothetical protein